MKNKMEEQIIINKTERPNSFETGKAGARFKIYYSNPTDLKNHLKELEEFGFDVNEK